MATLTRSFLLQQHGQLVDQVEIARIGQGDFERPVVGLHRHEVVAEHQVDRNGAEQVVIDADFAQVDELAVVALGQRLRALAISCSRIDAEEFGRWLP